MQPGNVVQKIWNLCHILRGDGITYYQYISELSYILFLKFAQENGAEKLLPAGCRWNDLCSHNDAELLEFYQKMLTRLGEETKNKAVREIYAFPTTVFSHSENLRAVINGISSIDWHEVGEDKFGDIYSGLIAKSQDARSGAGQYFTPRAVVDMMVELTSPVAGEVIQDPAVGSGGFLVAADRSIKKSLESTGAKTRKTFYQGVEIEKNTRRICLMNTFLHDINADIIFGDALTEDGEALKPADLILANPPFGAKAGSRRSLRKDIRYPGANKQLAFLQHIYRNLKPGGRAAVVLPENVLFEDGSGKLVRQELMECCNLHTVLRLPNGIFSGTGVKTNVLFFGKPKGSSKGTQFIWFYDLRSNVQPFGKNNPLGIEDFKQFIELFGSDPREGTGRAEKKDAPRWRCMTRKQLAERDDNLDWIWLRDQSGDFEDGATEPDEIAALIMGHLRAALDEIEALSEELEDAPAIEVVE